MTIRNAAPILAVSMAAGLAILLPGCLSATPSAAATLVVEPGDSIQAAVDRAGDGDTVLVRAGRYRENITVCRKRGLKIVSEQLYGAHLQGDGKRPIGFHDCEFRLGTSTAAGAPGTHVKGFLITDGPGYGEEGVGRTNNSTMPEQGMQVIGAGRNWTIDSVRIERVANGIVLGGNGAVIADTVVTDIERRNAHFLLAAVPGQINASNPKIEDITISRATFTGCNTRDLIGRPAHTNCVKILQANTVTVEHVVSENHVGSAFWLDWRVRNYVLRFSRFADQRIPRTQKWMAAVQIEGNQSADYGPADGVYDDGQICFNRFEDNEFADLHVAETSNLSVYRNDFGRRSGMTLSVRDMGFDRHGAYPMSFVEVRDNTHTNISRGENENRVLIDGLRGNRLIEATDRTRADDLAKCAAHVRPAAYGPDCQGAFCGANTATAEAAYDPADFNALRLDSDA
ncbi:MAG: hypothetical protein ACFB6R_13615 [Alphaproteobacteria bacterium]